MTKTQYDQSPKTCPNCQKPLPYESRRNTYCSGTCHRIHYAASNPDVMKRRSIEVKKRMADGTWKRGIPPRTPLAVRTVKPCACCQKPMSLRPSETNRQFCSQTCSGRCSKKSGGGYRERSGRGKTGWYKGFYCASSWELAWTIYHLDHGISFAKSTEAFPYLFEGESHTYHPDYRMADGTYVEIKGYMSTQWQAKLSQFPHPIRVLYRDDMKPIIQYVATKYGADYLRLYEGNPHNHKTQSCVVCGEPCKKTCCSRECSGKHVKRFPRGQLRVG